MVRLDSAAIFPWVPPPLRRSGSEYVTPWAILFAFLVVVAVGYAFRRLTRGR